MSNFNVLVVDDEEDICSTISDVLDSKGYQVFSAHNGVDGLRICAEEKIDLIVLDLNMPRMDGYMFMEHLRERWQNDSRGFTIPKIIVYSAVDKKDDLGLSQNLGAATYLNKPFKPAELVAAVKKVLGR